MTPNKLPPLPDSLKEAIQDVADCANADGDFISEPTEIAISHAHDQVRAYAAEALRQSQSLPSGAVADDALLADCYAAMRDAMSIIDADEGPGRVHGNALNKLADCRVRIERRTSALQADAREKGEAVAWRVEWAADDEGDPGFVILERERGALNRADEAIAEGYAGIVVRPLVYATQPAQASERDSDYAETLTQALNRTGVDCTRGQVRHALSLTHPQPVTPAGGEVLTEHGRRAIDRCISELRQLQDEAKDFDFDEMTVQALQTGIESMRLRLTHPPVADAALVAAGQKMLAAMNLQEGRETEQFHVPQATAKELWDEAKAAWHAALNQRGGGDNG